MKNVLLPILAFLICACASNKPILTWEAAEGTPREWLNKEYGEAPFVNTLNFYIENNPWSGDYQRALSIASNKAYLVVVEKTDEYHLFHYEIDFSDCKALEESANNLVDKLDMYQRDPSLIKKEAIAWFDGPDYTIESFGKIPYDPGKYDIPKLLGYGSIVNFANEALESAEKCASQLTNKGR